MEILEIIKRQAWEEGFQEGFQKGFQEIIQGGFQGGFQEGNHLKALAIATELKNLGNPFDFIAKITGLSVADIEKL